MTTVKNKYSIISSLKIKLFADHTFHFTKSRIFSYTIQNLQAVAGKAGGPCAICPFWQRKDNSHKRSWLDLLTNGSLKFWESLKKNWKWPLPKVSFPTTVQPYNWKPEPVFFNDEGTKMCNPNLYQLFPAQISIIIQM